MESPSQLYERVVRESGPPRPNNPRPIVILGAGGIVQAAHLPAYEKAGFPVIAIADHDGAKAASVAAARGVPNSFGKVHAPRASHQLTPSSTSPYLPARSYPSCSSSPAALPFCCKNPWAKRSKKLALFEISAANMA